MRVAKAKSSPANADRARRGQGVLEFAFVSVIFIFMLILTLNMILAFCYQQYLSYAAFMAARAYQASAKKAEDQGENAVRTLHRYIPGLEQALPNTGAVGSELNFPMIFGSFRKEGVVINRVVIPRQVNGQFGPAAPSELLQPAFVSIEFSVPIAQFPLSEKLGKYRFLTLEARSFLGREASEAEVELFFQRFFARAVRGAVGSGVVPTGSQANGLAQFMSDNGM